MGQHLARGAGSAIAFLLSTLANAQTTQPAAARVDALLAKLTADEKITLLAGVDDFYTRPIERVGIPRFKMTDGPNGTRVFGKSTAYPAGMLLAATWDPALAVREGEQLGRDSRARGCHFLLGPGMNIYRHPLNGRNFEYFGEDPLLTGMIAAGYVRGVESQGVSAVIKHFAANNQETHRSGGSSEVDERTLREIYLPAFRRAIDAGQPGAVMCSYNRINGTYASANRWLLTDVLRGDWHYGGLVMSDWGAVHDTLGPITAGLDLEMPGPEFLNAKAIAPLMAAGQVTQAMIDEKVRTLLTVAAERGWLDRDQTDVSIPKDNPEGARAALDIARGGLTLLKNEGGLLPLDRAKVKNLVIVGGHATQTPIGGGGSGYTEPFRSVSIADGIRAAAGAGVRVTLVNGEIGGERSRLAASPEVDGGTFKAEYFANEKLEGTPVLAREEHAIAYDDRRTPIAGVGPRQFSARWRATITPTEARDYYFFTNSDDGSRVRVDGRAVIDDWSNHGDRVRSSVVRLEAGKAHELVVEYYDHGGAATMQFGCGVLKPRLSEADVAAIRAADAVVACVGYDDSTETEGHDREYALPDGQGEMLDEVTKLGTRTAVVLNAGGSCDAGGWLDRAPALLHAYYAGQAGGTAIAEVLFGDVNPSGRLPFTIERQLSDVPSEGHWGKRGKVDYVEGVFVGYRGFDAKNVEPRFPFGFGLSYTTFTVENARVVPRGEDVVVSVDVANTGSRAGATVAQVYVAPPKIELPRPPQELRAFAKVQLAAGEKKTIEMTIKRSDLAYWDPSTKAWTVTPGDYEFRAGTDSRHTPARAKAKLD